MGALAERPAGKGLCQPLSSPTSGGQPGTQPEASSRKCAHAVCIDGYMCVHVLYMCENGCLCACIMHVCLYMHVLYMCIHVSMCVPMHVCRYVADYPQIHLPFPPQGDFMV